MVHADNLLFLLLLLPIHSCVLGFSADLQFMVSQLETVLTEFVRLWVVSAMYIQ